jgi:ribosome-associated protein
MGQFGQGKLVSKARKPAKPRSRQLEASQHLLQTAARVAAEMGGTHIVALDMTGLTALFDYFLIVTGTSRRQLRAMADEIDRTVKDELHDRRMNIEGQDQSSWVVLDYTTVVVHLFDNDTRAYYSLEALWADAPRFPLDTVIAAAGKMSRG